MRTLFTRPVLPYNIGLFLLVAATGAILSLLVEDVIILIAVMAIEYIVLIVFVLHVYDKYIRPIEKAVQTVDELLNENYRARIYHPANGTVGELSQKINALARNLSELSIQEAMREEQLTTVIDNTESGLVLLDEKGYIHLVNRKFISMFGKTTHDYQGHVYYDVVDEEKIHVTVQKTFMYEQNVKESFTLRPFVEDRHIEIVGAPIFNDRNMLNGAVLVLYDITELKKLEIMRKDFVANVSHELKTPITSIKGFAETLLHDDLDTVKNEEFLSIIYRESNRLQLLLEDLLTLSNLEKDEFRLNLSRGNIKEVTDEIMPVVTHKAESQQISFTHDIPSHLMIEADLERIKQIFINLLNNAISYTHPGGEVKLAVDTADGYLRIHVEDSGIGIEEELQPRIFERFYRVDKARSRNTGGTGLGLAIVKHIVEVHNGTIEVASVPDEGTTFTVYIPLVQGDDEI